MIRKEFKIPPLKTKNRENEKTRNNFNKLPCHVNFPHISSIALFRIFSYTDEVDIRKSMNK